MMTLRKQLYSPVSFCSPGCATAAEPLETNIAGRASGAGAAGDEGCGGGMLFLLSCQRKRIWSPFRLTEQRALSFQYVMHLLAVLVSQAKQALNLYYSH